METILQHGNLIDGLSSQPLADSLVIYEGDKILYAGPYRREEAERPGRHRQNGDAGAH